MRTVTGSEKRALKREFYDSFSRLPDMKEQNAMFTLAMQTESFEQMVYLIKRVKERVTNAQSGSLTSPSIIASEGVGDSGEVQRTFSEEAVDRYGNMEIG